MLARGLVLWCGVVGVSLGLLGCGGPPGGCSPEGATVQCTCANGVSGTQTCQNGQLTLCSCSGGTGGGSSSSGGGTSGTGGGTSSGNGGGTSSSTGGGTSSSGGGTSSSGGGTSSSGGGTSSSGGGTSSSGGGTSSSGGGTSGTGGGTGTGNSWTILVYMNADNDLESFALEDLEEMMTVGDRANFRIVVEVDRHPGYANGAIGGLPNFTSTKRVLVKNGSLQELADLGELRLDEPAALTSFVQWGLQTYPADRVAIVFWDHGAGWPGFGVDETSGPGAMLTLPEIDSGLAAGLGTRKVTLIGYDACLMAAYEVAHTTAARADYLLASQDVEPGHGWDWSAFAIAANTPSTNPEQLGAAVINGFRAQAMAKGTAASITLSLVDLREMAALKTAVDAFAAAAQGGGATIATALGRARDAARSYQSTSADPQQRLYLYDLDSLVKQAAANASSLSTTATAVSQAVARAVKANHFGSAQVGSAGLTIYFPPSSSVYQPSYADVPSTAAWRALLSSLHGTSTGTPTFSVTSATVNPVSGGLQVSGALTPGSASSIASASLLYGFVFGGRYFLSGQEDATYSEAEASALWDLTLAVTSQNATNDAFAYSTITVSGTKALISLDFFYRATPSSAPRYAPRIIAVNLSPFQVESDDFYVQNGSAFGALAPVAGSTLVPVIKEVTGSGISYVEATDTPYDATQTIDLSFRAINSGVQVLAGLEIHNAQGQGDLVVGGYTVP